MHTIFTALKSAIAIVILNGFLIAYTPQTLAQDLAIETPDGWVSETIELPPPFAAEMKLNGVEELRFAPGMFVPDSDSFFSYVFVFELNDEVEANEEFIKSEMLLYYRGLANAVLGDDADAEELEKFSIDMSLIEDEEHPGYLEGVSTYSCKLQWIEPFVTKATQELVFELRLHDATTSSKSYWFVCASPLEQTKDIWPAMREIRAQFEASR